VLGVRGSLGGRGFGARIVFGVIEPSTSMNLPPPPAPPGMYRRFLGGGSDWGALPAAVERLEAAPLGVVFSFSLADRAMAAAMGVAMRSLVGRPEVETAGVGMSSGAVLAAPDRARLRVEEARRGVAGFDDISSDSVFSGFSVFRGIGTVQKGGIAASGGGGAESRDAADKGDGHW